MLMEHNIPVYEKFEAMLEKHSKVILITATGTGKSYVTAEYLERHNLRALVIAPRIAICNNWKELTDHVEAITYNRFYMHYEDYYYDYDCYIFDESHHMAAEKWGMIISRFLEKNTKPVIGLTAKSKRYTDNVDVAEEFFDGKVVYGYGWSKAIENNILPKPIYISSIYSTDGLEDYYDSDKLTEELIGRLKYSIDNFISIKTILRKHISEHRKAIVFVDSIDNISSSIDIIKDAFPNAKTSYIHSKLPDSEVKEVLEAFKKEKEGFIFSVDMLNEGLHIDYIDTVIMLRKTCSPMVYLQQIGRALAPKNKNVIIFDFVANNISIGNYNSRSDDIRYSISGKGIEREPNISDQIIVFDYNREIFEVLEKIDSNINGFWTEEEDNIIREFYPKIGYKVLSMLPNRSKDAVRHRKNMLKVVRIKNWTKEEDDIIREHYPKIGIKVAELLPNRSINAVNVRASKLGVKFTIWSKKDEEIIRKYYPDIGPSGVHELIPYKSEKEITSKAQRMKIKYNNLNKWTKEEDDILRKYYPMFGPHITEMLPKRSKSSITNRAKELGIRKIPNSWTKEEDDIIRELYPSFGTKIVRLLNNRTKSATVARANLLNVFKTSNKWTKEEDDIIREFYPKMRSKVIELLPKRNIQTVCFRAKLLGVKCNRFWTKEEEEILKTNYPIMGRKVINLFPYRSYSSVSSKINKLGLDKK